MNTHHKLNYIELPGNNFEATKAFYASVFGWQFESYGPEYLAFTDGVLDGGFYTSDQQSRIDNGAALVILYSACIDATLVAVQSAGAVIAKPMFDFPGGRRFHFLDPNGNELAVWSDA
ncbi:VOC family protein [Comamonadaceae bacterium M7527]|nr:VOC family protein [Comamonadaceae bacterium M7527]